MRFRSRVRRVTVVTPVVSQVQLVARAWGSAQLVQRIALCGALPGLGLIPAKP